MKKVKKYNEYLFVREQIKIEFDKLSEEAEAMSGFYSGLFPNFWTSEDIKVNTSWYKKILNLGEPIIPFLLEKLNTDKGHIWLPALNILTNHNPVPESHTNKCELIIEDWKNWGKENGYIK